jgi:hypothetical protein
MQDSWNTIKRPNLCREKRRYIIYKDRKYTQENNSRKLPKPRERDGHSGTVVF